MPLPSNVQSLVDEALAAVKAHPGYELGWQRRKAIYDAFKAVDPVIGQKAHGWSAVIAARHVLSIWENGLPDTYEYWRLDARKWLKLAQKVLRNRVDVTEGNKRAGNIHYMVGNMSEMIYDDGLQNMSIGCALQAAHLALSESCGADHFRSLGSFVTIRDPELASVSAAPVSTTDEAMAVRGFAGDTLASAAFAFALDYNPPEGMRFDVLTVYENKLDFTDERFDPYIGNSVNRPRLLKFWKWWLIKAIPAAWDKANAPLGVL